MEASIAAIPAPLDRHRETVLPEWTDYNGHMNVAYYVLAFDHGTDVLLEELGLGEAYRAATGCSFFVLEQHVVYVAELKAGDLGAVLESDQLARARGFADGNLRVEREQAPRVETLLRVAGRSEQLEPVSADPPESPPSSLLHEAAIVVRIAIAASATVHRVVFRMVPP